MWRNGSPELSYLVETLNPWSTSPGFPWCLLQLHAKPIPPHSRSPRKHSLPSCFCNFIRDYSCNAQVMPVGVYKLTCTPGKCPFSMVPGASPWRLLLLMPRAVHLNPSSVRPARREEAVEGWQEALGSGPTHARDFLVQWPEVSAITSVSPGVHLFTAGVSLSCKPGCIPGRGEVSRKFISCPLNKVLRTKAPLPSRLCWTLSLLIYQLGCWTWTPATSCF